MKKRVYLLMFSLSFSLSLYGTDIILGPSSKITVEASMKTIITCSGNLDTNPSSNCEIIKKNVQSKNDHHMHEAITKDISFFFIVSTHGLRDNKGNGGYQIIEPHSHQSSLIPECISSLPVLIICSFSLL